MTTPAIMIHATAVAIDFRKPLASLRLRLSQASVRSDSSKIARRKPPNTHDVGRTAEGVHGAARGDSFSLFCTESATERARGRGATSRRLPSAPCRSGPVGSFRSPNTIRPAQAPFVGQPDGGEAAANVPAFMSFSGTTGQLQHQPAGMPHRRDQAPNR